MGVAHGLTACTWLMSEAHFRAHLCATSGGPSLRLSGTGNAVSSALPAPAPLGNSHSALCWSSAAPRPGQCRGQDPEMAWTHSRSPAITAAGPTANPITYQTVLGPDLLGGEESEVCQASEACLVAWEAQHGRTAWGRMGGSGSGGSAGGRPPPTAAQTCTQPATQGLRGHPSPGQDHEIPSSCAVIKRGAVAHKA